MDVYLSNHRRHTFPRPSAVTVIFLTLIALAGPWGCDSRPGGGPGQAREGGVFIWKTAGEVENLDPAAILFLTDWQIASLVYEGLVAFGPDFETIRPLLAQSWDVSPDGRRWVFTLRPDTFFQDDPCFPGGRGRRVVSADVRDSLERVAAPGGASSNFYLLAGKLEGLDSFHDGQAPAIAGIRLLDDRRIEFRLTRPYVNFLKVLATPTCYVVPKEATAYYGDRFATHPVGSGPFKPIRFLPLKEIVFRRHSRYWGRSADGTRLPYLEGILVRFDSSPNQLAAEFIKGENYLLTTTESENQRLRHETACQLIMTRPELSFRCFGVSLDTGGPLARQAPLRRAAALAFDRAALARSLADSGFQPAQTLAPPAFLNNPDWGWLPHDPGAARLLFGQSPALPPGKPIVVASNIDGVDVKQLLDSLRSAGVNCVLAHQPVDYYGYIVRERPDLFRVSYTPSLPDPLEYYSLFYSRNSREINLTGYRNPAYDTLYEASERERDPRRRRQLHLQMERILREDVPAIYLQHGQSDVLVAAPFVRGMKARLSVLDFSEVWLEKQDVSP